MTTDISVGVRWDPMANHDVIEDYEFEYDGGNSSSRLFERSRIKALAGNFVLLLFIICSKVYPGIQVIYLPMPSVQLFLAVQYQILASQRKFGLSKTSTNE